VQQPQVPAMQVPAPASAAAAEALTEPLTGGAAAADDAAVQDDANSQHNSGSK
jgi:hypothetical protein